MILKRRYCRKHGHDLNPDPGDFVLHCLRCRSTVDMTWLERLAQAYPQGQLARGLLAPTDAEILLGTAPPIPVKEVIFTARHWLPALEQAHYTKDWPATEILRVHGIHANHCGGYETLAWPCPLAAGVLKRLLCGECGKQRPCPIHDWHGEDDS